MKNVAVILAAGQGKRMNSDVKKQFLRIEEESVLSYSVHAFEQMDFISDIIIVTAREEFDLICEQYRQQEASTKPCVVVVGGVERYHSVYQALKEIGDCDYVFIHDAARPLLDSSILKRAYQAVLEHKACVIGMPSKDTVKIATEDGFVAMTPNRENVWIIQTPQVFEYQLIWKAYSKLMNEEALLKKKKIVITDDAMVAETFSNARVKLVEGDYHNIKITTPEDIQIASVFIKNRKKK